MASIGDIIRQNVEQARSTIQRARTRVRSRAEGLLPSASSNPGPGGVLGRLRSGGILASSGTMPAGGIMERVQEARQRLMGGAGGSVLGKSKVKEAGSSPVTKVGKVRII